ncbi:MAG TPA: DNA polymerase/3'-5' exonuclease PolX, partial [Gemmataceae bacterium]|nr:DNA polymerase/3'-5' exonuclease PolX [Gemmataceae bacterium]
QGENSFRCNAYHSASRSIQQLETNLADIVAGGKLTEIPGIGDAMSLKIKTLVETGKLPYYEDLRAKTPAGLLQMLRLPSIGPKKVKAMYDSLGIDTLEKLKQACDAGQVAELKGFGAKTQQKIMEGLAFLDQMGERLRLDQALPLGLSLLETLKKLPGVIRIELCGSLRRRRETIKDIDLLISSKNAAPIMDAFVKLPEVHQITGHGETKSSVVVAGLDDQGKRFLMNADLRVVKDEQFPFALNYFTGSKEHNVAMRQRAIDYGLKLNEYELSGAKKKVPCKDEADIYKALDLDYVEPEMREQSGELEAAAKHQLPKLVNVDDLKGAFHCHTRWSDGAATLEEMAAAAKKLGWKYLGIGDHSQSLTVANGLSVDRVRQQHTEIDALNGKLSGIKLFKGTECDILGDGQLDFPDEVLATFDYVVASVHTLFNQPPDEMTRRIVKALSNPHVTMLGHATGRLLLRRDGYKVDLEAVLQAAAKHGKMIEINAHPMRLDLDWIHCKRARALGVKLVINPDAHSTGDLEYLPYGISVARRGWLTKEDVFNTLTAGEVAKSFQSRRN